MDTKKLIFISIIICLTSHISYGQYKEFIYDGNVRQYAVYEPSLYPNPDGYPLVVGLHGGGSEGYEFLATPSLIPKARQEQFIVAAPNALRHPQYPLTSRWNAGDGYETATDSTDDVGFISALIDTMIVNYNIDKKRVYVMGFSNGSMMTYRVADELSHKIAAIGAVSGQMAYEDCHPEFPVSIIHFHGLDDPKNPYEGGPNTQNFDILPVVDTVMANWRGINNCSSIPDTILNENGIVGKKWASLDGNGDIILYTIENWGHKWPTIDSAGINATAVIWDFLKLHHRSIETNVKENDTQSMPKSFILYQNYPNPFNPSTRIKYQLTKSSHIALKIYNLTGQEIAILVNEFQSAGEHEITWQPKGLPNGLYFYKIQVGDYSETKKLILPK